MRPDEKWPHKTHEGKEYMTGGDNGCFDRFSGLGVCEGDIDQADQYGNRFCHLHIRTAREVERLSLRRCATCRHWERENEVYTSDSGLGICRKITSDWRDTRPYPIACLDAVRLQGGSATPFLTTQASFGCTEHSPHQEPTEETNLWSAEFRERVRDAVADVYGEVRPTEETP